MLQLGLLFTTLVGLALDVPAAIQELSDDAWEKRLYLWFFWTGLSVNILGIIVGVVFISSTQFAARDADRYQIIINFQRMPLAMSMFMVISCVLVCAGALCVGTLTFENWEIATVASITTVAGFAGVGAGVYWSLFCKTIGNIELWSVGNHVILDNDVDDPFDVSAPLQSLEWLAEYARKRKRQKKGVGSGTLNRELGGVMSNKGLSMEDIVDVVSEPGGAMIVYEMLKDAGIPIQQRGKIIVIAREASIIGKGVTTDGAADDQFGFN